MRTLTLTTLSAWILLGLPCIASAAKLPRRIENQIKSDVVPAALHDDHQELEKTLTNWVAKLDKEQLDQVDEILDANGASTIGTLLLDARITRYLADPDEQQFHARELSRSMPVLRDRIRKLLAATTEAEYYQEELPDYATIQEFHDVFWDIHVAENKLTNAIQLAEHGNRTLQGVPEKKKRGLDDTEKESLAIDFFALAGELRETKNYLNEIRTELYAHGIAKAARIVRESDDYPERLRAGAILAFYADPVLETLEKTNVNHFQRPLLKDPELLPSVKANVRYARDAARDVIDQAMHLYLGMHWWMRGRYGQGPEGMGLLKNVAAIRSPAAQFPLYMPVEPPTPTPPSLSSYGGSVPRFDRRHHYIWMYEYRTIQQNFRDQKKNNVDRTARNTSATKLSTFL